MAKRKQTKRAGRTAARRRVAAAAETLMQTWPNDPMGGAPPLQVPGPEMPGTSLPTTIIQPAQVPVAKIYPVGTEGFRYWVAGEALRRAAAFWTAAGAKTWHPDVGATLPVRLDDGVDLNAYYARNDFPSEDVKQGLSFFHDTMRDTSNRQVTVFSGESPDVVAHELGHGVLDTLKPALFEVAAIEAAAFHESFGDMSAILTALQLPTVRQTVLEETAGNLRRNSSVSRLAEQLGFAIRQRSPSAVDSDSLRNAANSFIYVDPLTLSSSGPATQLTRAPHNFSRVFTGAFLEALGGMVQTLATKPTSDDVLQATADMGKLLARAVVAAPVSTKFFSAVAEQVVLADSSLFSGKYAAALTTAFVRRNLIPVRSLAAPGAVGVSPARAAAAAAMHAASAAGRRAERSATADTPVRIAIDGAAFGLAAATLYVSAPPVDDAGAPPASLMASLALRETPAAPRTADVQAFCESLIVRGRVAMPAVAGRKRGLVASFSKTRKHATHYLAPREDNAYELKRISFECC